MLIFLTILLLVMIYQFLLLKAKYEDLDSYSDKLTDTISKMKREEFDNRHKRQDSGY